eukprot:113703_1
MNITITNNDTESKDECDIRLWLVIDHENERLNKPNIHPLTLVRNIYDAESPINHMGTPHHISNNHHKHPAHMTHYNDSVWSELNAKQSHCASGSMWSFQTGKSFNVILIRCGIGIHLLSTCLAMRIFAAKHRTNHIQTYSSEYNIYCGLNGSKLGFIRKQNKEPALAKNNEPRTKVCKSEELALIYNG